MRITTAIAASISFHLILAVLPAQTPPHSSGIESYSRLPSLEVRIQHAEEIARSVSQPLLAEDETAGKDNEGKVAPAPQEAAPVQEAALAIPIPYYYYAREVSERAKPAETIVLSPPELYGPAKAGRVILTLWISETGSVDNVEIESSDTDPSTTVAIEGQFRMSRFVPAQLDGKPVKSRLRIEALVPPPPIPKKIKKTSAAGN